MAYPSVFPGDLDSYVRKTDGIDDVMAVDVNELQSAIEAIETKLRTGTSVPVHTIDGADHTVAGRTAGQILIATAAATFGWSAGTIVFGGASASLSLPNAAITMTGGATTLAFGATGRTYTFPDTAGTVALLQVANSFTLINPLTTIAESWIGPSSTAGIYFKGGMVGIGTTTPTVGVLQVAGGASFTTFPANMSAVGYINSTTGWAGEGFLFSSGANDAFGMVYAGGTAYFGFVSNVAQNGCMRLSSTKLIVPGLQSTTGFGCNGTTPQTAYASGGALAAYATGAFGLNSDANMSALHALVVKMRAALVANGIMS